MNAAELLEQHPHLTLGQVFSALAYYWDHQSEMDALLAADELETERLLDRVELEEKLRKIELMCNFRENTFSFATDLVKIHGYR